ncbi:hypothetical protein [Luteibacter sp. ME-Dv--P-043b]|jgi:hypothetical protein|uniref:hypothetical protein n=1 Tax=Luteibacter sp. ME-Dv--P-043b TaxID=3040291 RepID=UPI002554EBEA|nr:hypothetical protein [Luteibacter sp. ME-Dv--P-043b]
MKKMLWVLLFGIFSFFAFIVFIPILAYIKTWMLGLPFDLWAVMPIVVKFGAYGAVMVMVVVALGTVKR